MPGRRVSQKNKRAANSDNRRRLVAAAGEHFFHHGFQRVTMDDLAEELGVSKKTLYAFFPSKDALLEAALAEKFARLEATLKQRENETAGDFAVALHAMLASMQRELDELKPPFVRDMRRREPAIFQRIEHRRAQLIDEHFGKLLRRGRREGSLRTDISVSLIIETLLSALAGVMNPQKSAELGLSPKEIFTQVIELTLHGALSQKGGRRQRHPVR